MANVIYCGNMQGLYAVWEETEEGTEEAWKLTQTEATEGTDEAWKRTQTEATEGTEEASQGEWGHWIGGESICWTTQSIRCVISLLGHQKTKAHERYAHCQIYHFVQHCITKLWGYSFFEFQRKLQENCSYIQKKIYPTIPIHHTVMNDIALGRMEFAVLSR